MKALNGLVALAISVVIGWSATKIVVGLAALQETVQKTAAAEFYVPPDFNFIRRGTGSACAAWVLESALVYMQCRDGLSRTITFSQLNKEFEQSIYRKPAT